MAIVSGVDVTNSTINAGQINTGTSVVFSQSRIGGGFGTYSVIDGTGVQFIQDTFVASAGTALTFRSGSTN